MAETITIGLARMHVEFGERRDFLPPLVADLEKRGAQVFYRLCVPCVLNFFKCIEAVQRNGKPR